MESLSAFHNFKKSKSLFQTVPSTFLIPAYLSTHWYLTDNNAYCEVNKQNHILKVHFLWELQEVCKALWTFSIVQINLQTCPWTYVKNNCLSESCNIKLSTVEEIHKKNFYHVYVTRKCPMLSLMVLGENPSMTLPSFWCFPHLCHHMTVLSVLQVASSYWKNTGLKTHPTPVRPHD